MRKFYTTFLTVAILTFTASLVDAQQKIEKSFEGIDDITLNLSSGDCIFEKGSSSTIKVTLEYTYDNENFIPKMEQKGSRLIIEEKFENGHNQGWSKWSLQIPDGLEINVNSGSGDITASGLKMELKANSGSADINFSNMSGESSVNTGSGEVEVDGFEGDFSVNTGSGDIRLSDSKGHIKINAGSGNIRLSDSNADFSINTGSGDISARDVVIAGNSSFNSGSGDSEIILSGELNYNLSVNSGSGDAVVDFNGQEISGFVTMKANKRNGEIIAPFEFDKVEEEDSGNQTKIKKTVKLGNKDIEINVSTGSGKAVIKK